MIIGSLHIVCYTIIITTTALNHDLHGDGIVQLQKAVHMQRLRVSFHIMIKVIFDSLRLYMDTMNNTVAAIDGPH